MDDQGRLTRPDYGLLNHELLQRQVAVQEATLKFLQESAIHRVEGGPMHITNLTFGPSPYLYASMGYRYAALYAPAAQAITIQFNGLQNRVLLAPGLNPVTLLDGSTITTKAAFTCALIRTSYPLDDQDTVKMAGGTVADAPAVVPSDTVNLPGGVSTGLYIGGAGNVHVTLAGGNEATFNALAVGMVHPFQVSKVWATGTTATYIQVIYG